MSEQAIMAIFIALFVVHLAICFVIFTVNKNTLLKKRFFPYSVIINCLLFASLMFVQFYPRIYPLFIFLPFMALIVVLNIKFTKFCDRCGKFRYNRTFWEKMNFCQVCGENFKD